MLGNEKKNNMRELLIILSLIGIVNINATNYYVSTEGSDSNAGTQEAPVLTLAKAASLLNAGDTCFIMAGTYRETLVSKNAGTSDKPIVYTKYENDEVIISATEVLSNWEVHDGDIYKTNYVMGLGRLNTLFCNEKTMDFARWPNNEDNDVYTIDAYADVKGGSGSTIETSRVDGSWVGGYVCYMGAHSGMTWTRKVTASSSSLITFEAVDINKWPFNPHNPTVFRNQNRGRFFLMGTLEALDYEREWYYEEGKIYFKAPGGVDPNTLDMQVRERSSAVVIEDSYNVVTGLKIFGGNVNITADHCTLSYCEIKEGWCGLDELDNTSAQVAEAAVKITSSYVTVDHNIIDGSSLNGIVSQGWGGKTGLMISNNEIKNCNSTGIHASPVRNGATHTKIYGNTIYTTGRDGIYSSATNCEISYNDVYDVMRINNDGGVYYTVGNANDKNTTIHHNWFHDSEGPDYADGRCAGIYLDNHSKGYVVHHNVVWNITWSGIQLNWDNWNIDIYNNSLYNMESAMDRWENGYTLDDVVLKNNYGSHGEYVGTSINPSHNVIVSRPPFVSVTNKDFTPRESSYVVDEGTVIEGITDGYFGDKPDIGAYEYGLTPWRPGVDPVMGGDIASALVPVSQSTCQLYPNPSQGFLHIDGLKSKSAKLIVLSMAGRQLMSFDYIQGDAIDLSDLKTGTYLLRISENNITSTHLFQKN